MSFKYYVYRTREEEFPMENLLDSPSRDIITGVFVVLGLAGILANTLVISIYAFFYTSWRITSRLWINMSVCMLCSSVVLFLRSVGDNVEWMSDTAMMCRFRVYTPTALDIVCFAILLVMLFDRLSVVHFLNLYIYNEKNNSVKILYGWLFGLAFYLYKFFANEHDNIPYRCKTPYSLAFPLETVSLFSIGLAFFLLLVAILGYIFTPKVNSSLHHSWVEIETAETVRVILLASIIILLWMPKHLLGLVYLTQGMDEYKYQIWMVLMHIPPRVTPLLPLILLLRIPEFRQAAWNMIALSGSKSHIQNLIAAEETKADFVLRSVATALYPNHPELKKAGSLPSPPAVPGKRGLTGSFLKKCNEKLGTQSTVTFEQIQATGNEAVGVERVKSSEV